jgi:hypothetical protein
MNSLPQRSPRLLLDNATPAVLRFQDGRRTAGELHVVSMTGGLLSLSKLLDQGSRVKLMFLMRTGSVLGGAEMLPPVASDLQPFRFTSLAVTDQRRLGATIQASLQKNSEQQWMDKLRGALADREAPRSRWRWLTVGILGLAALATASTLYLIHLPLLK